MEGEELEDGGRTMLLLLLLLLPLLVSGLLFTLGGSSSIIVPPPLPPLLGEVVVLGIVIRGVASKLVFVLLEAELEVAAILEANAVLLLGERGCSELVSCTTALLLLLLLFDRCGDATILS